MNKNIFDGDNLILGNANSSYSYECYNLDASKHNSTVSEDAMKLLRNSEFPNSSELSVAKSTRVLAANDDTIKSVTQNVDLQIVNTVHQPKTVANINASADNTNTITPQTSVSESDFQLQVSKTFRKITDLINKDKFCLEILKKYHIDQELNKTDRNRLIRLIIKNEINSNRSLKPGDFHVLSASIVKIFTTESTATYYQPSRRTATESLPPSGKLYSTYLYYSKVLKKSVATSESSDLLDENDQAETASNNLSEELRWLERNFEPEEEVLKLWKKTANVRLNTDFQIDNYIKRFMVLKTSLAPQLVAIDFNFKFGQNDFAANWRTIKPQLISILLKEKFIDTESCANQKLLAHLELDNDQQDLIILALLPSIIRPTFVKSKRDNTGKVLSKRYRPSKAEVLSSIFIIVPNDCDIQSEVIKRQQTTKTTFQPTPLFVGVLGKIERCWITFDGVKYSFRTVEDTLVNLFNFYYALNAEYPVESKQIWMLLQITCLKKESDCMMGIDLTTLLKKLKY